MNTEKRTIFISHVAPNDNYFAAWLASKLKLLGYEVWVELDELKIGDAFWPQIERAIRTNTLRFITVVSKEYCEKVRVPGSGVFKEISCADRIKDITNFLCPIRIDETVPDDFPVQLMGLHSIDFFKNWQNGLDELLKNFNDQKIPYAEESAENPIPFWLDAFKIEEVFNTIPEKIYTNWFSFKLPEKIYVHQPLIAREIDALDIYYPYISEANRHISFFPSTAYPKSIGCHSSYEYSLQDFLSERILTVDDFYTLNEPRKKLVKLLNHTAQNFFLQRGLKKYEQANTEVFYYSNTVVNKKRISLKEFGKTNVTVTGRHKAHNWCFGFSVYANLHPYPFFKVNAHLIFENSDHTLPDTDEQHALRQGFGAGWYNKKWLDTMLGCMVKLSNYSDDSMVSIPISPIAFLSFGTSPIVFDTDFGYTEPNNADEEGDE